VIGFDFCEFLNQGGMGYIKSTKAAEGRSRGGMETAFDEITWSFG
jgi:hypothetical protein